MTLVSGLRKNARLATLTILVAVFAVSLPAMADDWPTYRHDSSRSGLTASGPQAPMPQRWVFTPQAPPTQAWAGPRDEPVEGNWEQPKVDYDAGNQIVAVGDHVYIGSSGDSRVYCLDAATGQTVWTYMCGGPVRLAPSVYDGRVYFGSDDGHAYCVSAQDGSLIWRVAAGLDDEMCIGNGHMISRWPIRTDVLVDNGVAYFGAGIFPHEGVYVTALDATTGEIIWRNDVLSQGNAGRADFSPQGYILASATRLFIPSGRSLPAAFDRETGREIFQSHDNWRSSGIVGGTYALLHGDHILVGANQAVAYSQDTGRGGFAWFPARRLVVGEKAAWMSTPTQVQSVSFEGYAEASRLTKAQKRKRVAAQRKLSVVKRTLASYKKTPADQQDADHLADLEKQVADVQAEVDATAAEIKRLQDEGIKPSTAWSVDRVCTDALIVAGNLVFGGGDGVVVAFDAASGDEVWSAEVKGRARSLAVAGDALYVGTTDGLVYSFGQPLDGMAAVVPAATGVPATDPVFAAAADAIVKRAGITRGYALVLGATNGALACEIAARTDLKVYCQCPDDAALQRVRKTADARGMLGSRVWAERGDPGHLRFSDYFANLTVCESLLVDGTLPAATPELVKRIKPCGGVVCIGRPANSSGASPDAAQWVKSLGLGAPQVSHEDGEWAVLERGALPGAGDWTHQYADAANTTCGSDTLVKAPFRVLWYGDPGPDKMISRHLRAAAPLVVNGRFFAQGFNNLMCYDAYNGLKYWERDIPGAKRGLNWAINRGSNLCANQDAFFAAIGGRCLRLDPDTGETVRVYDQPGDNDPLMFWNYVATVGDLLYGATGTAAALGANDTPVSYSRDNGRSTRLFALDLETGKPRWIYEGVGEIHNITVSIGDGKVFFAATEVTDAERAQALASRTAAMEKLTGPDRKIAQDRLARAEVAKAWCLDAQTGEVLWSQPVDVTDCGGLSKLLITMYKDGTLVFCGAHSNGHLWHQFLGGEFGDRRVIALDTTDGHVLWQKAIGYRIRPIIVGDMLVAEPWAFDLRTGKQRMRKHPLTGEETPWQFERYGHHCGCIAGNNNTLFFRSWSLAYYDLIGDYGTSHFAAQRPGCWINFLPAAGLLIMPEASSGCQCLFPITTTTVFEPYEAGHEWGAFSSPGPHKPVREAHIDLGGPGDRRDSAGNLWLSYPRPSGRMKVPVDLKLTLAKGGGYFRNDADAVQITGSDTPWVFGTGVAGLTGVTMPLLEAGSEPMIYTVRLHFADLADPQPGARVFDIKLQGQTVLEGLDIAGEAGGKSRAVIKQFEGVKVRGTLKIEFVPRTDATDPLTAPLLNAIELKGVPDPAMQAEVGNFEQPMEVYNLGYWYADFLRETTGADIALIPGAALWSDGEDYPAGPVTLGHALARLADARLVRYTVSGATLLDYLSKPWVMDRFNPYYHPKSSLDGNPLYCSGMNVVYDTEARRAVFDIKPQRTYSLVTICPFAGELPTMPPDDAALQTLALIPGLTVADTEPLAETTWDLLESAAKLGPLGFTRRHPEPLPVWAVWRKQFEEAMGFGITKWPADKPAVTMDADADAFVSISEPDTNFGDATSLSHDGGSRAMMDASYKLIYLRFPVDVPGKPIAAKLRLRVGSGANDQSTDTGDVYLVEDTWDETTLTYNNRPVPTERVGELGDTTNGAVEERLLQIDLRGRDEVTLALVPTSVDGGRFLARESDDPPQLIIAYEPE